MSGAWVECGLTGEDEDMAGMKCRLNQLWTKVKTETNWNYQNCSLLTVTKTVTRGKPGFMEPVHG